MVKVIPITVLTSLVMRIIINDNNTYTRVRDHGCDIERQGIMENYRKKDPITE